MQFLKHFLLFLLLNLSKECQFGSVNFYDNSKEDVLNDDFQSLLLKPFVHEKAIISVFFLFWDYMNRFFRPKHWREQ